jgi:hypothetical protein
MLGWERVARPVLAGAAGKPCQLGSGGTASFGADVGRGECSALGDAPLPADAAQRAWESFDKSRSQPASESGIRGFFRPAPMSRSHRDCLTVLAAIASLCSRDPPRLILPSPVNYPIAAMCVQPRALAGKAIQYMVLYCLTPPPFHRYSCLNLWWPPPAGDKTEPNAHLNSEQGYPPG